MVDLLIHHARDDLVPISGIKQFNNKFVLENNVENSIIYIFLLNLTNFSKKKLSKLFEFNEFSINLRIRAVLTA